MPDGFVGTNYFGWQDWAELAKSGVCHSCSKPLLLVWELSSGTVCQAFTVCVKELLGCDRTQNVSC